MAVRIGVDVGGTFTKAVACEASTGALIARAVVPTTHRAPLGVVEGLVKALEIVSEEVARLDLGPVLLVGHSTTQAVNALLEGDTSTVGILGIGRRPDLARTARRTRLGDVQLAPGRKLRTLHAFLDATDGLERPAVEDALRSLLDRGAHVICVSEAFSVDDPAGERLALEVARDLGVPACAGHELTGLYGLEVRTVTAAVNASILPTALATASVVREVVGRRAPGVPLLVMRGDGGAASVEVMRRRPLMSAFSGPAASVAGALASLPAPDALVVEVGGTSTNVSAIRGGQPILSFVRVLGRVTCVRSLDVRVVGTAGGSMVRVGRRLGGLRLTGIGPRSAHIAGLPYCSFARPEDLEGAAATLVSPREGDPAEYAVVESRGRSFALTLTCAANALGRVPEGAAARGNGEAARLGFEALGRLLHRDGLRLAEEALRLAAADVGPVIAELVRELGMSSPALIGLGGGAGALLPSLAGRLGLSWDIPPDAEVISSIGDALSLIRVEVERVLPAPSPADLAAIVREAEDAAAAAGADPSNVQVDTEAVPERGSVRAVATGAAALRVRGAPLVETIDEQRAQAIAVQRLKGPAELVAGSGFFLTFAAGGGERRRFVVVDRRGSIAASCEGQILSGSGHDVADALRARISGMTRRLGPMSVAPTVRIVRGSRLIDLSPLTATDALLEAASAECSLADGDPVVALISRA